MEKFAWTHTDVRYASQTAETFRSRTQLEVEKVIGEEEIAVLSSLNEGDMLLKHALQFPVWCHRFALKI